jgi:Tol biopolymer transport system component
MPLLRGQRLGPYEIAAPIGAGGMGEVYKARDTRLERDVAVKVLPALFARDPDRQARLEQEARAAAALNASGIVAVYDIGTQPIDGQPLLYVVMELLDGESLRTRLDAGAVPPRKAAEYASQVAAALAVAHGRGIVHRDLKPENLFLTRDGRIKILDFGLAKETAVASASVATGIADTAAGTVLGTAGYMAPEQVRGEPADARSDIFALGATLYEMLTGQRAFARETTVETMNAILKDDPPEIAPETIAVIPGALHAVLSRCLEKRPDDRFHSAHDLALALQAAASGRATTSSVSVAAAPPGRPRLGAFIGMGGLLIGAAGAALALRHPPVPAGPPAVTALRQLTEAPGAEINPDISPDGRQVVYAAGPPGNLDVYLLRVGGGRAIDLTANSPGNDAQPAFSPDGEQIAFRSDRDGGGLFVMGATGESVRRITSAGTDPRWSPDGRRLAYATEAVDDPYSRSVRSELWTVDVASGQAAKLWSGDGVQPVWSPRGTRIAFWANDSGQRDIKTIASSGGAPVAVTRDAATDWAPEWSPDGRWLYFVSDRGGSPNLWRIAIDESTGAVSGAPEMVTNGVRTIASARFARDGSKMVLAATDRSFDLSLYSLDPARPERLSLRSTLHSPSLGWCAPSHTAAWLACTSRSGQEDIVLMRSDGSETRRLTDDAFKDRIASWSPDDRYLAFMSTRSGRWEIWQIGVDGSALRQVTGSGRDATWAVWSPDGTRIAVATTSDPPYELALFDPSQTAARTALATLPAEERADVNSWSSDGTLLAGTVSNAAGDPVAILVWDVAARRIMRRIELPLVRVSAQDTSFIHGTHLIATQTRDGIIVVDADSARVQRILAVKPPFSTQVSGDGRTLLVEGPAIEGDLWLMEFGAPRPR